jgi:hypothetical protein
LYVAEYNGGGGANSKVKKCDLTTTPISCTYIFEGRLIMTLGSDNKGNVYIAYGNRNSHQKIAKCTPDGTCDDDWCNPTNLFNKIHAIEYEPNSDKFYVYDEGDEKLWKVNADGTREGEYDTGLSDYNDNLAIHNGIIYTMTGAGSLKKYAVDTTAATLECSACPAGSTNPAGDLIDNGASVCGTCDADYYVKILPVAPAATAKRTLLTESVGGGYPNAIEVGPDGKLYVTEILNDKIYICPEDGTSCSEWAHTPTCANPNGIAWDSAGNAYVSCGSLDKKIIKIDTSGEATDFITGFESPRKVKIDSNDNLYVNDYVDDKVYKYTLPSTTQSQFGGSFDGTLGMGIDSDGNIYVGHGSTGSQKNNKMYPIRDM